MTRSLDLPAPVPAPAAMRAAGLAALAEALGRLRFDLAGEDRDDLRAARDRVVEELAGHRARLADVDAPLLVVLGGVTGAGKSTIVNTLVGRRVARTGVIRPTTSTPTLVTSPADAAAFAGDRVLGGLARVEDGGADEGGTTLRLFVDEDVPAGLALVDAPDVDSVRTANRDLADLLLDAADLWLWATTAGKYADEESMRYLRRAAQRDTAIAVLLTRVRPADADEVAADFRVKLAAEGLGDVPLLVVPEAEVADERLAEPAVAELRAELLRLADPAVRRERRLQTLEGALAALPDAVTPLLVATAEEGETAAALLQDAARAYAGAGRDVREAVDQGLPLQQEVLGRWDRFVGTGRMLRMAEEASGHARSWVRALTATATNAEERREERAVRVEVADTVAALVGQAADLAAADAGERWRADPAGARLLAADPSLAHSSPDVPGAVEEAVAAWQDAVVVLVETRGADRRTQARWVSGTVNAGATAAILVALSQTGGITGAEVGIAGGAAAANQALLTRLLGAHNLRWLVARAREELLERVDAVLERERERYDAAVAAAAPSAAEVEAVEAAVAVVG